MKTFPLHMDEDLHKKLKHASIDEGKSLHAYILDVLKTQVDGVAESRPQYDIKGQNK